MKALHVIAGIAVSLTVAGAADAQAVEKFERKGRGEWVYEYQNGHREVKRERKPGGYKEEIKYRNGVAKYESKTDGRWKEEIKDGDCEIKGERTRGGGNKEERTCQGGGPTC